MTYSQGGKSLRSGQCRTTSSTSASWRRRGTPFGGTPRRGRTVTGSARSFAGRGEPVLDVGTGTGRSSSTSSPRASTSRASTTPPTCSSASTPRRRPLGLDVDGRVHLGRMSTSGCPAASGRSWSLVLVQLLSSPTTRPRPCVGSSACCSRAVRSRCRSSPWARRTTTLDQGGRPRDGLAGQADTAGRRTTRPRDRGHGRHLRGVQNGELRTEHFSGPARPARFARPGASAREAGFRRARRGRGLRVRGPRADRGVHGSSAAARVAVGGRRGVSPRASGVRGICCPPGEPCSGRAGRLLAGRVDSRGCQA